MLFEKDFSPKLFYKTSCLSNKASFSSVCKERDDTVTEVGVVLLRCFVPLVPYCSTVLALVSICMRIGGRNLPK